MANFKRPFRILRSEQEEKAADETESFPKIAMSP